MSEEQWLEIVRDAVKEHLSLDKDFVEDWNGEIERCADTIAKKLRVNGFNIPRLKLKRRTPLFGIHFRYPAKERDCE